MTRLAVLNEWGAPEIAQALADEREAAYRDILREVNSFGSETARIICRKIMNYKKIKGCTDPGPGYRCADTDCEYNDGKGCTFPVEPPPSEGKA